MADQLRYDALGFQGAFPVSTPNIDRLAEKGTVFDSAYCSNPLCVPARASIWTGLYSHHNGVYYNETPWDEDLPTLAGKLGSNGYYCVAVGKRHFRPAGDLRGFHKRLADTELDYPEYLRRKGYEFASESKGDGSVHCDEVIISEYKKNLAGVRPEDYMTNYLADHALHELDLIDQRREWQPGGNEPFFLYLSFQKPHTPCDPPEPYASMYDPEDLPDPVMDERQMKAFPRQLKRYRKNWECLDDSLVRDIRARYLGNITLLDEQIGRVIEHLQELGMDENTLIIFTSDHGDHMGDHGLQQKGTFFDCSARVPLIFNGPGVAAGRTVSEPVSHVDLFPTLLDYTHLLQSEVNDPTGRPIQQYSQIGDGEKLTSALEDNDSPDARRIVVCESGIHGLSIMLRQGNQKFNYYEDTGEIEHYDLAVDPDELNQSGKYTNIGELPEDIRCRLKEVLAETRKYDGMSYKAGEKVYRMFT
jgi:arylsulfatase A-like enzyme